MKIKYLVVIDGKIAMQSLQQYGILIHTNYIYWK